MKYLNKLIVASSLVTAIMLAGCEKEESVPKGDAIMTSFSIGAVSATISGTDVTIQLAPGADLTSQTPTITVSSGATVSPESGVAQNFTAPVVYTVTDQSGTVENAYTVTVSSERLRKILMVATVAENTDAAWDGLASAGGDEFPSDDKAATAYYREVISVDPIFDADYMSFEDASVATNLSDYDMIWVQYAGGSFTGRHKEFPHSAPEGDGTRHSVLKETGFAWDRGADDQALEDAFKAKMKEYYDAGGNLLLGNYAAALADQIGVNIPNGANFWEFRPNNDFGEPGGTAGCCADGEWGDHWTAGSEYGGLIEGITLGDNGYVSFLEIGSIKHNRTFQWLLTADWATWPWAPNGDETVEQRQANFETDLNCEILLSNDTGTEVHGVLYKSDGTRGTVISYVTGLYDFYVGSETTSNEDVKTLTRNSLKYLADLN